MRTLALVLLLVACDGSSPDTDTGPLDAPRPDVPGLDAPLPDVPGLDAPSGGLLRDRHPGDEGLAGDPAVLFFDDFESGWGRWDAPSADTEHLFVEEDATAHGGARYLRATVTHDQLRSDTYISASPRVRLPRSVPDLFVRLHARFVGVAPNPHHWIRFSAGDAAFSSSGLANTVPPGDSGFWFDWDANVANRFSFYVYWFQMRSGRCNDGTAVPGCAGDQGTTYYYGNTFVPPDQAETGFARDTWVCIELGMHVNTVGESDGALEAWVDDVPVGRFGPGEPVGTWLRDTFHPGGCSFSACTEPVPFEGFELRSEDDVLFKEIFLDSYYQLDTWERTYDELVATGATPSETSTILYDDVVAATERIGCRR